MRAWTGRATAAAAAAALVGAGLAWGGGPAAAQGKPPPLGAPSTPAAPPPGGKFAAPPGAQATPPAGPPAAPPPGQRGGKFDGPPAAAAPTPPASPPPQAAAPAPPQGGKFGPSVAPPGGAPPPAAAPPAPPPVAAAPAPPADEPAAVRTLRALLGPGTTLTYGAMDVLDPARGAVRLRDVTVRRPDRTAEMAELTLDGLREDGATEVEARGVTLREAAAAGPTAIERLRLAGLSVRRPGPGEPLQPDMVALDALRIEGLVVQGETPVSIGLLSLEDYGTGRAGRMAMEGLEVRQPAGQSGPVDRVSLGRVSVRGFDLAATFAALVAKGVPPPPMAAVAIEADDLVLGQGDRRLASVAGLRASGDAPAQPGQRAEQGRFALRELRVEPVPGLEDWLRRFGYAAIVADMTGESRYDRAAGRLEFTSLSLAAREMGALSLSMTLDGVSPDAARPAESMASARLVSMALRYADQSLYQRFVRQQARETRQSEAQVRQALAQQAAGALASPPPGGAPGGKGGGPAAADGMGQIAAALQRFLRGEAREIEIAARPPRPIPLAELQGGAGIAGPADAQRVLGLTATAR